MIEVKLRFTVDGPPKPKARPRVTSKGTYTPKSTKTYENAIGNAGLAALAEWLRSGDERCWPMNSHYRVTAHFRHKKQLASCPDGDNCLKAVQDALEGILYSNDRLVIQGTYMTFPDEHKAATWVEIEVI